MSADDLANVAAMLVADGKGILAADETVGTLTKRFDVLGIRSTEQSRRTYREMLFTSGVAEPALYFAAQDVGLRRSGH